ncbi:S-adenosylmethionine uptake transporter [Rhizobium sp. BK529]|uniref:DMT family transporter n=1 Tax=unclassified Rhizobium TaxID=2613769 RepID=UPI001050C144|nr:MULTISPECIES: DMT family transporter [unclassified Rhizobium]MBB3591234.1 S-adenosylmethionine uptake transporter [Rhizobium sp. BK529]TCS08811.1 S-adenosylmethionine uptake transporter [Rhizobium sp. BK418]
MNSEKVESRPLAGIALACAGYACFAMQDALVKWLVADYEVPEILFMRSLVIVVVTGVLVHYRRHPSILKSPYRGTVVLRAMLMLIAWLLFYNAARYLGLAELTTLYFSAPIIVMFLSILVLKEAIGTGRWIACIGGFIGVAIAANPTHSPNLVPAVMCLIAGFCWAWSTILIRLVSRSETTLTQMFATSLLFGIACTLSFPWIWKTPDVIGWALMIGLGLVSTLGQFLLYEGFRYAPASALAPVEYSGLIWAFVYGYAIWAEVPEINVFVGALIIIASSLVLVAWERQGVLVRKKRAPC